MVGFQIVYTNLFVIQFSLRYRGAQASPIIKQCRYYFLNKSDNVFFISMQIYGQTDLSYIKPVKMLIFTLAPPSLKGRT